MTILFAFGLSKRQLKMNLKARLRLIPWSAQIINWWQMDGLGDTKEAAFADLKAKLQTVKEEKGSLPRPGGTSYRIRDLVKSALEYSRRFFPESIGQELRRVLDFRPVEFVGLSRGRLKPTSS
jgi:hypothetical protein